MSLDPSRQLLAAEDGQMHALFDRQIEFAWPPQALVPSQELGPGLLGPRQV
jgi:hypothetical protein